MDKRTKGYTVERWAVERYDREAEMLRIEVTPATESGAADLLEVFPPDRERGLEMPSLERMEWWDSARRTTRVRKLSGLARRLGIPKDAPLGEGMVFYLFTGPGERRWVANATALARELAKVMYNRLLSMPEATRG